MSETPVSPLRQRMLEDMSVRRFTPDTQREYIRAVKRLAAFLLDLTFWPGDIAKMFVASAIAVAVHKAFPALLVRRQPAVA